MAMTHLRRWFTFYAPNDGAQTAKYVHVLWVHHVKGYPAECSLRASATGRVTLVLFFFAPWILGEFSSVRFVHIQEQEWQPQGLSISLRGGRFGCTIFRTSTSLSSWLTTLFDRRTQATSRLVVTGYKLKVKATKLEVGAFSTINVYFSYTIGINVYSCWQSLGKCNLDVFSVSRISCYPIYVYAWMAHVVALTWRHMTAALSSWALSCNPIRSRPIP